MTDTRIKLFEMLLRQKMLRKGIKGKSLTPQVVSYSVTRACNLNCPHCHADARDAEPDELTLEEATLAIDEVATLGSEVLIFSGGEPLLRKNFVLRLTEHCIDLGIIPAMLTNGILLDSKTASELKDAGMLAVGVPLDFAAPKRHDEFRGVPGVFKKTVEAIKACLKVDLKVVVTTMALKENFNELPKLVDLLVGLGVDNVILYDFVPTGRGKEIANIGMPQEQWAEMLDYIRRIHEEMDILFTVSGGEPLYPGLILELHKQYETNPPDKFLKPFLIHSRVGCHAATHYFSLRPNGDVYPCPFLHLNAGNIRKHSLMEIWYNSKLFNMLRRRSLLKGKCGNCAYRENCGGCRARAYVQTGDYMESDPNCPLELFSKKRIELSAIECFGLCIG